MEFEFDDTEEGRVNPSLIAGSVMAAMLLILTVFLAQFPEIESPDGRVAATKVARR